MSKLILSEQEKNRIQSLYEISSPPPSESVLIANKNPFKNDEYKDARRVYSPSLENGDMFHKINVDEVKEYNRKHTTEFIKSLKPLIDGKTLKSNDIIWEIFMDDNGIITLTDKDSVETQKVKWDIIGSTFIFREYSNENNILGSFKINDSVKDLMTKFMPYSIETYKNTSNGLIEPNKVPETILRDIPDEFFEIRKIERVKTDF